MDTFTGQRIEINGDRYTVEGEPEFIRDEYRVTCKPDLNSQLLPDRDATGAYRSSGRS
jgi:hypothetical protein